MILSLLLLLSSTYLLMNAGELLKATILVKLVIIIFLSSKSSLAREWSQFSLRKTKNPIQLVTSLQQKCLIHCPLTKRPCPTKSFLWVNLIKIGKMIRLVVARSTKMFFPLNRHFKNLFSTDCFGNCFTF